MLEFIAERKAHTIRIATKGQKEFEGFLSIMNAEYINEGIPELIKNCMQERFANMLTLTCSSNNIHADWHTHWL